MDFSLTPDQVLIRDAVREVCTRFPGKYWRDREANGEYPTQFVMEMTRLGWLSVLIPEEYGGGGQGVTEAGIILEEIHRSGGNANACHAQLYTMGALARHGSEEQKQRWLPPLAAGELRLQAFGITEPDAGSDSTRIATRAERDGADYVITGQKTFISRAEQTDLMLLLARTGPPTAADRAAGLSLLLIDLREAGGTVETRRIPLMFNYHTYQVFFSGLRVPAGNLIGAEGRGFRQVLDGFNAERCLLASEAIGDGLFFLDRASEYASRREVFGRPIGANQGVAFPIARAHADMIAAELVVKKAAALFEVERDCGAEANMGKMLAADAAWKAAEACLQTFGGFGYAREYGIERKWRECRLYQTAPISTNMVLAYIAQHVLGLPRSY